MENEAASRDHEEWLAIPANLTEDGSSLFLPERRARLWALVLESRYLPCRLVQSDVGFQLLVPSRSFASSLEELSMFERENRGWPPFLPAAGRLAGNTLTTVSVLILLATFHNITRVDINLFGSGPVDWAALGNAHSSKILNGEWWRLVTSLTLHADWLHLISNLTLGGVFIVLLCQELGSGLAWALMLASGILGNLANALLQHPGHRSLGASTLVFGALGILAAINLERRRSRLRKRWLLPVAAAIALLALLGTEGKETDLGAHFFGFVFGILTGFAGEFMVERRGLPGRGLNAILSAACAMIVVLSWWAAIVHGG